MSDLIGLLALLLVALGVADLAFRRVARLEHLVEDLLHHQVSIERILAILQKRAGPPE